jgi:hypothetical protein
VRVASAQTASPGTGRGASQWVMSKENQGLRPYKSAIMKAPSDSENSAAQDLSTEEQYGNLSPLRASPTLRLPTEVSFLTKVVVLYIYIYMYIYILYIICMYSTYIYIYIHM